MKRTVLVSALLILASIASFGQVSLSAGAGGLFSPTWNTSYQDLTTGWSKSVRNINDIAIKAYFDATYVELGLGAGTNLKHQETKYTYSNDALDTTSEGDGNVATWLSISALGKYPFRMSKTMTVFPMFGFEYDLNLSYENTDGDDLKESLPDAAKDNLNRFWLKVGAGADIGFGKSLYLRPELLFGYKLNSEYEKDNLEALKALPAVEDATQSTIKLDIGLFIGTKL